MSNSIASDADFDEKFELAFEIADKHLKLAMAEGGILCTYVTMAMIEAAVNSGVDQASHNDVIGLLRELANQVEEDAQRNAHG